MQTRRQRLGQHFLHDERVVASIVQALPDACTRVIEIGPGKGALTRRLLQRCEAVRAVEVDPALANSLARRLGGPPALEVIFEDAVHVDLDALASDGPWAVVGNLPYSVASAIVRRLLPRHDLFGTLLLMVQLEVARRLVAPPGDGDRGLLSVEVEATARAELLLTVPGRCFAPPPRVTSAVVRLALGPPPGPPGEVEAALHLASQAFLHRRKQLGNALASSGVEAAVLRDALAELRLQAARPQDLALAGWRDLARAVSARGGTPWG